MWINRNSWHARVYLWWYNRKFKPWERDYIGPSNSVNLCPYVRTILFWAPIRWLTMWGPRKLNVAAETVGWMGAYYLLTLVPVKDESDFISLLVITTIWVFLLLVRGVFFLDKHGVNFATGPVSDSVIEKGASFFKLLGSYISKAHTQVCPQIELRNRKENHGGGM